MENTHSRFEIPPARVGGRLAYEILDLFADGAFSFWRWVPSRNVLTTHGHFHADSLEEWMLRIHPRDQAIFSAFIDQDCKETTSTSVIEYRFTQSRKGDWFRVRHTASFGLSGGEPMLSCLIESFPLSLDGETPLEKIADELKGAEEELLRFVDSAINLRIQPDPLPRLELLQHSIGADLMVLVHFGSKIIATHTLPLSQESPGIKESEMHLSLIEAIASIEHLERARPFDLDLPEGSAEVIHYIVSPIHWGDGFKGALCAGYKRKEDRIGDHSIAARLSLISAFTDGQSGRLQRAREREAIIEGFGKSSPTTNFSGQKEEDEIATSFGIFGPPPATKKLRASLEDASLKGTTILLVEDEVAVRKLVRKLLEMLGCSVVEAISGREALDIWPDISDRISLVVSDVVMPEGVSGWDLAKELHQSHPDLGILLTSGFDELPADHGLQDLPQIEFLQKPYEVKRLKTTLSQLMDLKLDAATIRAV